MVFFCQSTDHIHNFGIIKTYTRNIDGNRKYFSSLISPSRKQLACLFPDILIQLQDKTVPLKYRDKFSRRYHPAICCDPSHQNFCSCNGISLKFIFGLQIQHKLFVLQRILHIVDDALLLDNLLTHLFCVKEIVLDIISLTVFGCKIGFVIHFVDGKITVFHKIYPKERRDIKIQRIFFHLIREFLHKVCDLFLIFIRKAYRKNICLNSSISNITIFFFHILQIICHIL